ncbi:LysR substrate-binding domain-containing protein [Sphingomonas sp. TDK1]|uniref:LysR substrate-binding domain-containing protein n=1 Tax=Sphingomonas sp. TDK1 TaxID=453247 RepID=UPI0012ED5D72|nr:LysR substrate-binding domain-containing protein [Sphingomonas sp. TDK1]
MRSCSVASRTGAASQPDTIAALPPSFPPSPSLPPSSSGCDQRVLTLALRGTGALPGGNLVVTAPVTFGRIHILPIGTSLLRRYPRLDVELTLIDRVVRLVEEGIDVAARIGDLSDSALHALKVAEVRRVPVASPGYLAARGTPETVPALRDHALISFTEIDRAHEWRFGATGKTAIRIEPRLTVNTADAAIAAAVDGLGIARVPLGHTADEIALPPAPVHLVYQANRRASVNVRAFIEAARVHFGGLDLTGGTA